MKEQFVDGKKLLRVIKEQIPTVTGEHVNKATLVMLESLDSDAQLLLADEFNKHSNYNKRVQSENIAHTFCADPSQQPILYHYTTLNALKAIVDSRSFLIGRYTDMNDKKEKKYAYSLCNSVLEKAGASQQELAVFNEDIATPNFDYYIMSLTKNKNSQALANYGDLALQFNNQDVQDQLATQITPPHFYKKLDPGDGLVYPLKVLYKQSEQLEYINTIMHAWLVAFRNRQRDFSDMIEIRNQVLRALEIYSQCFKDPILYQEEEIRFVVVKAISEQQMVLPDVSFHNKPKIKLKIKPSMIKAVIVSHKLESKMNEIRDILNSAGFNQTKVQLTDLPY